MKKVLLLLCVLAGFTTPAFSQAWCSTPFEPSKLPASAYTSTNQAAKLNRTTANNTCYYVRVFFHLVRNSDGSGGQPISVVAQEMGFLSATYSPNRIYFINTGFDEIRNTDFQNNIDQNKYNSIINTQVVSNALNVYLLDNSSNFNSGLASGNPGRAVVIGGAVSGQNLTPSAVVAHELGHCLGLYHTFEESMGPELVDRSNCTTAGDLVCDTPAESRSYVFTENSSCVYTTNYQDANGQTYTPDLRNVMDYMRPSCLEHFTEGQSDRMKATLANSSVLAAFIAPAPTTLVIQGATQLCPSNSFTYTSVAIPTQWTSSNTNVATINSSTGAVTTVGQGSVTFTAFVTDACNNTSQGSISVTVGSPGVNATYVCSSGCNYPIPQGTLSGNDLVPAGTYTITLSPQGFAASSVSSWSWSVITDGSYYTYGTNNNTGIFTMGRGRRAQITVSGAVAGCGTASRTYFFAANAGNYIVAPNPADETVTISSMSEDNSFNNRGIGNDATGGAPTYEVILYDIFGQPVQSGRILKGKTVVDTRNLPNGIYNLRIGHGKDATNERIQVTH